MKKSLLFFLTLTTFLTLYIMHNFALAKNKSRYPLHENITATVFWVGEKGNEKSAWDSKWLEHYGGVDDYENRDGYLPSQFVPSENPFYFALPYNDFENGRRKNNAYNIIYWADEKKWHKYESMCKNRWIKIIYKKKVAYAQWEDVGPYEIDDRDYVFANQPPLSQNAGLDVSPAVRDYLGLTGKNNISWQFVDYKNVPDGPWKEIITSSQIHWR